MMEDNVPGFIGYHITRDGKLYSRRIERYFIHRIQIRNSLE